jgi:hypothetical protein
MNNYTKKNLNLCHIVGLRRNSGAGQSVLQKTERNIRVRCLTGTLWNTLNSGNLTVLNFYFPNINFSHSNLF